MDSTWAYCTLYTALARITHSLVGYQYTDDPNTRDVLRPFFPLSLLVLACMYDMVQT